MRVRSMLYPTAVAAALTLVGVAACESRDATPLDVEALDVTAQHGAHVKLENHAEVSRWLAGLKRATAPFHDTATAAAAGWNHEITGCMELPGTGGMGYHIANDTLIDNLPQEFAPELLVYAPQKNGRRQLVAVEYIVPFTEWTEAVPPSLHGIDFHRNEVFGLWVLHAWVWKHNPVDMFTDWNPEVTCPTVD